MASFQLKGQAAERQRLLEEARRRQRFQQKTREMRRCLDSVRERLLHHEGATDVASAVALLEQHQLLRLELEEQRNRWEHNSLTTRWRWISKENAYKVYPFVTNRTNKVKKETFTFFSQNDVRRQKNKKYS